MHCQAHVGERILHFRTIVEAETAHESVTHAAATENLFESARLKISAIFHGTRLVRIVVENAVELTCHKFCFCLRIPRLQILQIRSRAFLRAQRLAQPLRIVRDHGAGGVENILRRTVVALQFDDSSSKRADRRSRSSKSKALLS